MKKGAFILILIASLSLVQCATRGNPTGGDIDVDPPEFLRANPENYSTNFSRKEIRIFFDEYIKLDKPQQQIIISPPMDPRPDITPMGTAQKYARITINDTLEENTTYVINFGNSVVDNNEGNPLPFFKYVFSTGSYIDSLRLGGTVTDALLNEPDPFISVMLYEMDENYSDSLVYKQPPRYIANTLDSLTSFELTNLKEGTYRLIALKDANNDYMYNPGRDKIAFIEKPVTIPTDTTYNLILFKENLEFRPERPSQLANNKILIGHRGNIHLDSITVEPIDPGMITDYRITKVPDKDSIHLWIKPPVEGDSLKFTMITPGRTDTLLTRITDIPPDTLSVTTAPSGNINFGDTVLLRANTPLMHKDDAYIKLINRDSLEVEFTSELLPNENAVAINFSKNENETYRLTVLPGALTDFFDKTNDTISQAFKTRAFADYGNIDINLQNVRNFPIIIQLTNEKGEVIAENYSTGQTNIRFDFITPAKYLLRVIYDRNENGVWDTGNYLDKTNPEEIIYFPEVLDVRPNWDVIYPFNLN